MSRASVRHTGARRSAFDDKAGCCVVQYVTAVTERSVLHPKDHAASAAVASAKRLTAQPAGEALAAAGTWSTAVLPAREGKNSRGLWRYADTPR